MKHKRHIYGVLLSALMAGVALPFHPGIPWIAWVAAFIFFILDAELLLAMVDGGDLVARSTDPGKRMHSRRILIAASVAAILLLLVLVFGVLWAVLT